MFRQGVEDSTYSTTNAAVALQHVLDLMQWLCLDCESDSTAVTISRHELAALDLW